ESHAMPRTSRPPAYRLHKARNLAVVTLAGKDRYLGPYGSPESHERYALLIAEWHASGHRPPAAPSAPAGPTSAPCPSPVTVNEVVLPFWAHAKKHYRHADGPPLANWTITGTPCGPCGNCSAVHRPASLARSVSGPSVRRCCGRTCAARPS